MPYNSGGPMMMEQRDNRFASRPSSYDPRSARDLNDDYELDAPPTTIQGGALQTWWFSNTAIKCIEVTLTTEGCTLDADIQLWNGPDTTPHKIQVSGEDGSKWPFTALIAAPSGPNTVAVRNTGVIEFPIFAHIKHDLVDRGTADLAAEAYKLAKKTKKLEGGAVDTFNFDENVDSVSILLETDSRPLNARVELSQGRDNNTKQVIELETVNGLDHPFFAVIATPGGKNTIRVVNRAKKEYPLNCCVQPYNGGAMDDDEEEEENDDGNDDDNDKDSRKKEEGEKDDIAQIGKEQNQT